MLRIAEAREARGWTQEQLAQAIGTTQQTVQRWESGQVDPRSSKVIAISKALGITVSYLLGVDAPPAPGELTYDEKNLLELYRGMDKEYRDMLVKSAVAYVAMSDKNRDGSVKDARLAVRR